MTAETSSQGLKQLRRSDRESSCQPTDVEQRYVALATLYAAEIASRQSTLERQSFLREAGLSPKRRQLLAEDDARVGLFRLVGLGGHLVRNLLTWLF